ncbi:MAG: fimbria/pilus outer membrane usher protein [Bauldia sp.]
MFLAVVLNGQDTRLIADFTEGRDGRLSIAVEEAAEVGFSPEIDAPGGAIDLDAVPGIAYDYDRTTQVVRISAHPSLLAKHRLDAGLRGAQDADAAPAAPGAILNYALYGSVGDHKEAASGLFDLRLFGAAGLISHSAIATLDGDGPSAVRLNTTLSRSDPETLLTYRGGDVISGGLSWTRPIRMGGLQIQRNFSLRPDLVTMPLPSFAGSAAVPSTVEIFANGAQIFAGALAPGPFVLANLPIVSGAGTAHVVMTDALGRTTESELPYYASGSLLREGLADFSAEVGFPRRSFGVKSFDYSDSFAVSGSLRYGWTDTLTLEGHAEATEGLFNAGIGAVMPASTFGLLSVAGAFSAGDHLGGEVAVDLSANWRSLVLHLRSQRTIGDYADLASVTALANDGVGLKIGGKPLSIDQASLSVPLGRLGSATLSFTEVTSASAEKTDIVGLSYRQRLWNDTTLLVDGFHSLDGAGKTGVLVGLSRPLGNGVGASASGVYDKAGSRGAFDIARMERPKSDEMGWRLHGDIAEERSRVVAAASYRTPVAHLTGAVEARRSAAIANAEATGAIALTEGGVFFADRVDDAFAIVDVGAPNVRVYSENRLVGRTGANGKLLVAGLRSFQANRLSIEVNDLPADHEPARTQAIVRPQGQGGVKVDFGLRDNHDAALFVVRDAKGKPLPVGSSATLESGESFVVGYDGELYLRGLQAANRLRVERADGGSCSASFSFDGGEGGPGTNTVVCL